MGIPNLKYVGDIFSELSWFKKYGEKISFSKFSDKETCYIFPWKIIIYIIR